MTRKDHRDLTILENVFRESSISQRDLAKKTGLSLGLINALMKTFIQDGLIAVSHLNKKKVKYQLTPKGVLLLTHRNYQQTMEALRTCALFRQNVESLVKDLKSSGVERVSLHGDGEIRDFVISLLKDSATEHHLEHGDDSKAVILNLTPDTPKDLKGRVVNLMERISC